MTRVAILGNGPSAAYAFRACADLEIQPTVFAAGPPTHPRGAFWLHWMPPTIPEEELAQHRTAAVTLGLGTAEKYSGKMWGETFETSFPKVARSEEAFNPDALGLLWGDFQEWKNLGILRDPGVAQLASEFDLVLQTFPTDHARAMQRPPVFFPVVSRPVPTDRSVYCIYNGTQDEWVRMTVGWGVLSIEFPHNWLPDPMLWPGHTWKTHKYPDMHPSTHPITAGVAPNVVLLGRHARWDRRLLSDSAYQMTQLAIHKLQES